MTCLLNCRRCGKTVPNERLEGFLCKECRDAPALTLKTIMAEAHKTAMASGFHQPGTQRDFDGQIALMHSELSEALEAWRGNRPIDAITRGSEGKGKPEGVVVEFADVIIRICDTCEEYAMPLEDALRQKMAYNKARPWRHGGKRS